MVDTYSETSSYLVARSNNHTGTGAKQQSPVAENRLTRQASRKGNVGASTFRKNQKRSKISDCKFFEFSGGDSTRTHKTRSMAVDQW